ncbi:hypothetical protein [Mesorhizobium sp. A623]
MTKPVAKDLAEMISAAQRLAAANAYDVKDDGLFEAFHEIDTILTAALARLEATVLPVAA